MQELVTLFAKPIATYHPALGLIYPTIHKELAAKFAEEAIAQTLKAVADGMPLLDEVGRYPHTLWLRNRPMTTEESLMFDHYMAHKDEIETFIALSPTGTGERGRSEQA